jgi:flagellar biosynthesis protein FliP
MRIKGKTFFLLLPLLVPAFAWAQDGGIGGGLPLPNFNVSFGNGAGNKPADTVAMIRVVLLLTVLTLAPSILMMMTSFTRIIVVLSFLRQSLGTQQMPPNPVIVGLALFLSFFVMAPTYQKISDTALKPYLEERIDTETAYLNAEKPIREFMFAQTREKDLELFLSLSKLPKPQSREEVSTLVLIPAFVVSELNTAFQIGFLLYIPFLIMDMVVASLLMAMGMMMLPPMMLSLPFKILLFVLVDGWELVISSLVKSFG